MSINMGIRSIFLVSALVFGRGVIGANSTCPEKIDPSLCDRLQTMNDSDWVICIIGLLDAWPTHDQGCGRDTACLNHLDTSWMVPWRDSMAAESRLLFENYDLRWPDDPQTRAPMPTNEGRWDTISNQQHRITGVYILYATKHSILSMVEEPYISVLDPWTKQTPALLWHRKSASPVSAQARYFNLKGQRIQTPDIPGLRFQRLPENR